MNSNRVWVHLLVLISLFGLLYLMRFIFPHYEPEEFAEDEFYEETILEETQPEEELAHMEEKLPDAGNTEETDTKTQIIENNPTSSESQSSGADGYFTSLINTYRSNVLNNLQPGQPRTDVIIRYYKHPPDGKKVNVLRNLGFYIHERPVDQSMANYESNAIYYGDNVKKEDLLIVAYTLINQGMPIKNITPSQYHDDWKSNAIEIGADSAMIDKKPLTLEQLKELKFDFL